MKKSKFILNRVITYALVCLTLVSSCLLAGIYAKYTSASEKSGGIGVVEFNITQHGTIFENITTTVTPGTTQCAELKINNKCDGPIKYTLTVKNVTGNIPQLKFKLVPANANAPSIDTETESYANGVSTNEVIINSSTRPLTGEYTDEYYLNIVWEESANENTDLACMGLVDYVTISVTATQDE